MFFECKDLSFKTLSWNVLLPFFHPCFPQRGLHAKFSDVTFATPISLIHLPHVRKLVLLMPMPCGVRDWSKSKLTVKKKTLIEILTET